MSNPVLVLLGSPNDEAGGLPPVALTKCEVGLELLLKNPDWLLLPTGGFGDHFNRTDRPHWTYVRDWFSSRGVAASRMLEGVDSFNTLDDAVLTQDRLLALYSELPETRALTCAYHLRRATWIFERVFGAAVVKFVVAPDPQEDPELERLRAHEPYSLAAHQRRWAELHAESQARLQRLREAGAER